MAKGISSEKLREILANQKLRKQLAYEDPMWFCLIYLRSCFKYPLAPFHLEMFHILKNPKYEFAVIMAFRESGKSTIMNMANVLWSVLGKPQKKFIVVMSQVQEQAKNHFTNLKEELKYNELLREDFGPFTDNENDWKQMSLDLIYRESKIMSVSREQSVRGIKYNSLRPDLIICDDLEDSSSRSDEPKRDELYVRFASEILPLGSEHTRIIMLGNLICEDSLLMRLKRNIEEKKQRGIFRAYPIIDCNNRILWPGKFPNIEKIRGLYQRFPRAMWIREFLLRLVWTNQEGQEPQPIYMDPTIMKKYNLSKIEVLPKQRALIPQMKGFNILLPDKERIPPILSSLSVSEETLDINWSS